LAQGQLVILAGKIHDHTGDYAFAWSIAFALVAMVVFGLGAYHFAYFAEAGGGPAWPADFGGKFFQTFCDFFFQAKNNHAAVIFAPVSAGRGATRQNGPARFCWIHVPLADSGWTIRASA